MASPPTAGICPAWLRLQAGNPATSTNTNDTLSKQRSDKIRGSDIGVHPVGAFRV